jgi:hypothetical protein
MSFPTLLTWSRVLENTIIAKTYEVLSESNNEYAATHVHTTRNLIDQRSEVKSSVSHHNKQKIWLKDPHSEEERQLSFSNTELEVRPGQKLTVVESDLTQAIERIHNHSTGKSYRSIGHCNTVHSNGRTVSESAEYLNHVIVVALVFFAPVFGQLVGYGALFNGEDKKMSLSYWTPENLFARRTLFIAGIVGGFFWVLLFSGFKDFFTEGWFTTMLLSWGVITAAYFVGHFKEAKWATVYSHKLDHALDHAVLDFQATTSQPAKASV